MTMFLFPILLSSVAMEAITKSFHGMVRPPTSVQAGTATISPSLTIYAYCVHGNMNREAYPDIIDKLLTCSVCMSQANANKLRYYNHD